MKLLETKAVLESMLTNSMKLHHRISKKQEQAIERALREVEITIDNGDPSNL